MFQKPSNRASEKGSVPVQHPVAKVESPAGSKEADQPSPVSVLETPFPDDLSSGSECFESLSADLNGKLFSLLILHSLVGLHLGFESFHLNHLVCFFVVIYSWLFFHYSTWSF